MKNPIPAVATNPDRLLPAPELEVMKILRELGTGTVGEVQIELMLRRPFAYTTVMALLNRLTNKGAVSRQKQGRGYAYAPVLDRDTALHLAVRRLMRDFFDSSPVRLMSYLQTDGPPTNGKDIPASPVESFSVGFTGTNVDPRQVQLRHEQPTPAENE